MKGGTTKPRPWCSARPRRESRKDKYGQCSRLVCGCGTHTNWHTEWWRAETAINQISHNGTPR